MIPPLTLETDNVRFFIPADTHPCLASLPWRYPLDAWHEHKVKSIPVKSGLSRHVVLFIESGGRRFAIKETALESAGREYENYVTLKRLDIPTLVPVGVVSRDDGMHVVNTNVGEQLQRHDTGYLVTELLEKVVPDSFLFKRGFSKENRTRIWDAVIRLFTQMHSSGVFWGDASLANMLINFSTEVVPELGRRTKLSAILADAETVEIHTTVSDLLRLSDIEFFLESMQWTDADLRASGIVRDPVLTQEDQHYILQAYNERYAVELEMRSFELVTHMDVDKLLGNFDAKGYGRLLLKHIQEHKWYISEKRGTEVPLFEAAEDWYREIFKPVCRIFNEHGVLQFFPDKTASSLYVEIMEHKYFMSEQGRKDVGLVAALNDYAKRYSKLEPLQLTLKSIMKALTSFFKGQPLPLQSLYLA